MKTYGFGIIGCGMISDFHSAAIAELDHGKLVAVSSRNEDNARRVGDLYNVDSYPDYNEMLKRPDLDVVCICTPSGAHRDPAVAAAKAGKHVIVEKPLEVTLERCDDIIQACDEAGVRLCAIFNSRFTEGSQLVKQTIDSGRFGVLTLGDAYIKWFRTQEYYDSGGWRGTWAARWRWRVDEPVNSRNRSPPVLHGSRKSGASFCRHDDARTHRGRRCRRCGIRFENGRRHHNRGRNSKSPAIKALLPSKIYGGKSGSARAIRRDTVGGGAADHR